jgi:predicted dehydrogenase
MGAAGALDGLAQRPRRDLPKDRVRFAYVGTGGRVRMFLDPVATTFSDGAEIVGLCDLSLVRAVYHQSRLENVFGYHKVPVYQSQDFRRMLGETKPDVVLVCTTDSEHDRYIIEAMRAGCDVVTEKPMTITAEKCAAILDAFRETGRSIRVAFNYRWSFGPTKVREVLASGVIGEVRHVTMEYLLNTRHGSDYFRRWHAHKENSGGLLVHKATHHFDLINWWIDAIPEQVFAHGALAYYGHANAVARGDAKWTNYPRYHGHPAHDDPFNYDYRASMLEDAEYERNLYLGAAERETGYIRDRNVFRQGISIEDAMNVVVRYRTGALLSYSLNAFSPYEGYRVAFTGDRGRVEYQEWHGAHVVFANGNAAPTSTPPPELRVLPHFRSSYLVDIPTAVGGHGGGDPLLQEQIFSAHPPADPLRRGAGAEQGAASILVGIAANRSIAEGRPVDVSQLLALRPGVVRLSQLT